MITEQQEIFDKFPKLFPTKIARGYCAARSLECGKGWYDIIYRMSSIIQNHIDGTRKYIAITKNYNRALKQAIGGNDTNLRFRYKKIGYKEQEIEKSVKEDIERNSERPIWREAPDQIEYTQIKEKFGTLRVYTNMTDSFCDGVIAMAESMSAITCEQCGLPGKARNDGWIVTLCEKCAGDLQKNG